MCRLLRDMTPDWAVAAFSLSDEVTPSYYRVSVSKLRRQSLFFARFLANTLLTKLSAKLLASLSGAGIPESFLAFPVSFPLFPEVSIGFILAVRSTNKLNFRKTLFWGRRNAVW